MSSTNQSLSIHLKALSVSVVIPTYNSERTLASCLASIQRQSYPKDKIEIIVADGGSSDSTLDLATRFGAKILQNPHRTGEAGKAVGAAAASFEIVAFIDSDNVLPSPDWLHAMLQPFSEVNVVASEPLYYSYRRTDPLITRYCALMGMNDVLCLYLGNYDRYCVLTGKWTDVKAKSVIDRGNYLLVKFSDRRIPTLGANGFLIRRDALNRVVFGDYLFDIDLVYQLVRDAQSEFAKVKVGIVHLFANDLETYARKTLRRMRDYLYYREHGHRSYPWSAINRSGLYKFLLVVLLPPLLASDVVKGYRRRPDIAWLFHPAANWITFVVYSLIYATSLSILDHARTPRA